MEWPDYPTRMAVDKILAPFKTAPVKLEVGKDDHAQALYVHKSLLTRGSVYFQNALKLEWKEGQESAIKLPVDDPSIVEIYIAWLYDCRFYVKEEGGEEPNKREAQKLVEAYFFGDRIQDNDFRDAIIDALIHRTGVDKQSYISLAKLIYENTLDGDPLRQYWVDKFVYGGKQAWMENKGAREWFNYDFMFDVTHGLLGDTKYTRAPYQSNSCVYHRHGDMACYKQQDYWRK